MFGKFGREEIVREKLPLASLIVESIYNCPSSKLSANISII
jgi:hypothetical protein